MEAADFGLLEEHEKILPPMGSDPHNDTDTEASKILTIFYEVHSEEQNNTDQHAGDSNVLSKTGKKKCV